MNNHISRSDAFRTIPPRKIQEALIKTIKDCEACNGSGATLNNTCDKCRVINTALNRFADSNIPTRYWHLKMEDFKGSKVLLDKYNELTEDLNKTYDDGVCICFAGPHGTGKTLTVVNVLKKAAARGYQCLHVTLSDIVSSAVSNTAYDKFIARRELMMVDFLVIDEFDPRHMTEGAGADLFGRQMEDIFRRRSENKLPLFMCTNSPNVIDSFTGPIKQSINSLMNYATIIPIIGQDFRKGGK
ncbi:MAG: ATP-binding protein [bacterium]|nr:ATP-binding protein [bacterium]